MLALLAPTAFAALVQPLMLVCPGVHSHLVCKAIAQELIKSLKQESW